MSEVVVDVWVANLTFAGYMDRWHKLAAEFERAHPGYRIKIHSRDFRELPQEIGKAVAEGHRPAVAEFYFYLVRSALDLRTPAGTPAFVSLQKAIGGRTEILGEPVVVDDLVPALREYYSVDGELVSMPSVGTTSLLFSNRTLLDAAGVPVPRTWAQVDAACDAFAAHRGDDRPVITWSNHGTFFQQAVASQDGLLVDHDNGRAGRGVTTDLATPQMLAWARWWQGLHQRGRYLDTGVIPDWQGTFRAFAEQQVPFRISSSNDVNYMVESARAGGFELEVSLFPYNSEVPYGGNAIAGTSLWLGEGLDEATRDGALAFLQFLHNPRNAAERHKANSFVPATHASFALLEQEGWFAANPWHRVASDHLAAYPAGTGRAGSPPSRGAVFGDFAGNQDVMTRAMQRVLSRGADPETSFAEATVEAQALLDAYEKDRAVGGPSRPESLRVEFFTDAEPYSGLDLEDVVKLRR